MAERAGFGGEEVIAGGSEVSTSAMIRFMLLIRCIIPKEILRKQPGEMLLFPEYDFKTKMP